MPFQSVRDFAEFFAIIVIFSTISTLSRFLKMDYEMMLWRRVNTEEVMECRVFFLFLSHHSSSKNVEWQVHRQLVLRCGFRELYRPIILYTFSTYWCLSCWLIMSRVRPGGVVQDAILTGNEKMHYTLYTSQRIVTSNSQTLEAPSRILLNMP